MNKMKDLQYYLRLEYPCRVEADPDGGFVASIPDLPGCFAAGITKRAAIKDLEESKEVWLESYFETHARAPEPSGQVQYLGRVLVRMPKYLHRRLYEGAQSEGTSLNQYIIALLAEGSSRRDVEREIRKCLKSVPNLIHAGNRTVKRTEIHPSLSHRRHRRRSSEYESLGAADSRISEKPSKELNGKLGRKR